MEFERLAEAYEPPQERVKHWREFVARLCRRAGRRPGRALHGLRHAVLHERLPGQQHHPGLERSRLQAGLAARDRHAALDQQLSGSSPAACVRRRARPRARSTSTTIPSASSRSSTRSSTRRWENGWVETAGSRSARPASASRSSVRARRDSPARSSSRAPVTRWSCSRRPTASAGLLRYGIPDFKMEKHLIDRRIEQMQAEGVEFRVNQHVGRDVAADKLVEEFDAVVLSGRRRAAARPAGAGPRARRRSFRHGVSAAAEQGRGGRSRPRADPRDRQARRRDRRRRHRLRLRRHVEPPRRAIRHAVRAAAAAARAGEQAARVAVLADQAAQLELARGRLPARLGGRDEALRRARRQGRETDRRAGGLAEGREGPDGDARNPGHRVRDESGPGAARDGFRRPGARRPARRARCRQGSARQRRRPTRTPIARPCRRYSRPATCGAASRSSSGRSAKAGSARVRSTSS